MLATLHNLEIFSLANSNKASVVPIKNIYIYVHTKHRVRGKIKIANTTLNS